MNLKMSCIKQKRTFVRGPKNASTTNHPTVSLVSAPSSVQVLAGLSAEGRREDVRGRGRVLLRPALQPALHQHLRLLQVPLCGRLRGAGTQPQRLQGSVR